MPSGSLKTSSQITVRIVSTVPYRLFANGRLHSWGPWRGTGKLLFSTEHVVCPEQGKIDLAILAHHPARPSAEMDYGAPWLMIHACDAAGNVVAVTDDTWRTCDAAEWLTNVPASWYLRGMAEVFHASADGFQPSPPPVGQTHHAKILPDMVLEGKWIEKEPACPPLGDELRPVRHRHMFLDTIPRVGSEDMTGFHLSTWERWQSSLGVWYQPAMELHRPDLLEYVPVDAGALIFGVNGSPWQNGATYQSESTGNSCPVAVLFDYERQVSGFFRIRSCCTKACRVDFLFGYAEAGCLPADPHDALGVDVADCGAVYLQPGETTWTSFRAQGLRYVVLIVDSAAAVSEIEFSILSTAASLPPIKTTTNATDLLTQGVKVGARTLEICCSDSLFDCPTRERAQWLGDGMLSGQIIAEAFDEPGPMRRLVHLVVRSSLPGKFLKSVIPSDFLDEIPVCDLLLMENIHWYAKRYEPEAKWLVQFFRQRIETFIQFITPDGLLDEMPGRLFMDWTRELPLPPLVAGIKFNIDESEIPKGSPYDFRAPRTLGMNATINANWLRALRATKEACQMSGDDDYAARIAELEKRTRAAYVSRFFDPDEALIIEQLPQPPSDDFSPSELPCYAALAAGVLKSNDAERVIQTCMDPDRLMIRIGSPAGSRYAVEGLLRYGHADLARKYVEHAFGAMIQANKTLWEHFAVGNPGHAWGAYSIYLAWKGAF